MDMILIMTMFTVITLLIGKYCHSHYGTSIHGITHHDGRNMKSRKLLMHWAMALMICGPLESQSRKELASRQFIMTVVQIHACPSCHIQMSTVA
ncbi:hypothetical protein BZA77DRAFT_320974 [Pyronema omphalodes]|nr:hypothetical protein BZA77DRAFT_320974 [Pyronema omphalodes]